MIIVTRTIKNRQDPVTDETGIVFYDQEKDSLQVAYWRNLHDRGAFRVVENAVVEETRQKIS